jgi:O-antigen/teichoic acid export membrane protein
MTKSIMANSALNAAAGLTLLATGFACSIIAARLLGPGANGIIAFSLWLVTTGALVAELGTGITLLRILPQLKVQGYDEDQRRGFAAYLMQPTVVSTLVILVGYTLYYWEAERRHWAMDARAVVWITAGLFLTQSIGAYTKNYLIGEQKLTDFFRLTIISSVFQLATVLIGAMSFGVSGALAGYAVGGLPMFIYSLRVAVARKNACGIGLRYLVSSSLVLSVEFINGSIFLNRIELVFLQHYWNIEAVGFYAIGLTVANLALQLPVQLSGSLLPYYSEKIHSQAGGKLPASVFEGVMRSISYITLPLSFGLAAIAGPLVVAVFGPAFAPSGNTVALLALTAAPYVFGQICTQYLYSIDKMSQRTIMGVITSAIMVVGCFAVVPWFGGEGAALVRLIAFTALCAMMMRHLDLDGSLKNMFVTLSKIALASLFCSAAAYGFVQALPGLGGLIGAIIIGMLVYFAALRLLNAVPQEDISVLHQMASKLPKRAHPIAIHALDWLSPRSP